MQCVWNDATKQFNDTLVHTTMFSSTSFTLVGISWGGNSVQILYKYTKHTSIESQFLLFFSIVVTVQYPIRMIHWGDERSLEDLVDSPVFHAPEEKVIENYIGKDLLVYTSSLDFILHEQISYQPCVYFEGNHEPTKSCQIYQIIKNTLFALNKTTTTSYYLLLACVWSMLIYEFSNFS